MGLLPRQAPDLPADGMAALKAVTKPDAPQPSIYC